METSCGLWTGNTRLFSSLCGDVGCMLNYFVPFFVEYLHFFLCCVNANQVPPGAYTNKHIRLTLFFLGVLPVSDRRGFYST